MRKISFLIAVTLFICAFSLTAAAKYPASGEKIPAGSVLLEGEVIGEQNGWDGSSRTGSAMAFDGDIYSYYDPTVGASSSCYAGLELESRYILTKVAILPRDNQIVRFDGAMIQGSNDGEKWYTLWEHSGGADAWEWQIVTQFKRNIGYCYYRYTNETSHGDVAEVEFYGYSGSTGEDPNAAISGRAIGEVSVSFEIMEGVTAGFAPIKAAFGGLYPNIEYAPTRDGYVFGGWYTAAEGGRKITDASYVTNPEAHTLYARWLTPEQAAQYEAQSQSTAKPEDEVSSSSPIPAVCVTLSILSVAAAAAYIFVKRNKKRV